VRRTLATFRQSPACDLALERSLHEGPDKKGAPITHERFQSCIEACNDCAAACGGTLLGVREVLPRLCAGMPAHGCVKGTVAGRP
jgi:hypothetical protein